MHGKTIVLDISFIKHDSSLYHYKAVGAIHIDYIPHAKRQRFFFLNEYLLWKKLRGIFFLKIANLGYLIRRLFLRLRLLFENIRLNDCGTPLN